MIRLALWTHTDVGIDFQAGVVKLIKANAIRGFVSEKKFDALKADFENLQKTVHDCMPWLKEAASSNGKALQAQKVIKKLGDVN